MIWRIPEKHLRPIVLALIIILAGPEIIAASEMLALLELLGAANFILLYVYGLRTGIDKIRELILTPIRLLEPNIVFIPPWRVVRRMPSMLAHAVPMYCVALLSSALMADTIAWHGIQAW